VMSGINAGEARADDHDIKIFWAGCQAILQ
jgi:hypothetical protein